jgi:hypothetical protein
MLRLFVTNTVRGRKDLLYHRPPRCRGSCPPRDHRGLQFALVASENYLSEVFLP